MRKTMIVAAALVVVLAGCSSGAEDESTTSVEMSGAVPTNCVEGAETLSDGEDATGIGAAAATAALPDGVVYMGTQAVNSTDFPDEKDVIIRVCSIGITETEHREIATAFATSIEDADRPEIATMRVSSWVPAGDFTEGERVLMVDNYEIFLWSGDFADGIEPVDRWEVSSID